MCIGKSNILCASVAFAQFMSDDLIEMTDCLKTAKAALEQNLIEGSDYDQVKAAFLRAQQIRAGLDAGFIRQDDYDQIKQTFLQSLQGLAVAPSSSGQHSARPRSDSDHQQSASAPHQTLGAAPPQASQNGRQTDRTPSFSQPEPSASHTSAPAPAAQSGPVTSGGATIPADIPKMGGNRPKHLQGVRLLLVTYYAGLCSTRQASLCFCRHP